MFLLFDKVQGPEENRETKRDSFLASRKAKIEEIVFMRADLRF